MRISQWEIISAVAFVAHITGNSTLGLKNTILLCVIMFFIDLLQIFVSGMIEAYKEDKASKKEVK